MTTVGSRAERETGAWPHAGLPRDFDRFYFEVLFASHPDPWHFSSEYEQTKYARTLSLLNGRRLERALEVGCAEGPFTELLAPMVGSLVAADISQVALDRAAERCAEFANVSFVRLDLAADELPGTFDLVVCSELLYYLGDRDVLVAAARKLADAVAPGGCLLTAHANLLVDEPDGPGYDWPLPFGARVIGEVFADTEPLRLADEVSVPAYRIFLFERP